MNIEDARKKDPYELDRMRKTLVWYRKRGIRNSDAARHVGFSTTHASTIYSKYLREGEVAIGYKRRGRLMGEQKLLSLDKELEVRSTIIKTSPDDRQLHFRLWSLETVTKLVFKLYGIQMPRRTALNYMRSWGLIFNRPLSRSDEKQSSEITAWINNEYRNIKEIAHKEGGEIYWVQANRLGNFEYSDTNIEPQGNYKHRPWRVDKTKSRMLNVISNRCESHFMLFKGPLTAAKFVDIMERIMRDSKKKPYLILPNSRGIQSQDVRIWLSNNEDRIRAFVLPPDPEKKS